MKISLTALLGLAAVACALPSAASAASTPVIDSPANGTTVGAGSRTIAFTDPDAATYTLLRDSPSGGVCDVAPPISAISVDTVLSDAVDLVDSAALPSGGWCYWVNADDGILPANSAALLITVDVTAPAAPTGLTLTGSTPRKAAASFTFTGTGDSTDSYQLYRDGVAVGAIATGSPVADPGVPSDGTYTYTVKATDSHGNEGAATSGVSVRFDNTAPAAPGSFARTGPSPRKTAPAFSFATSSDLSGPITYQLFRDGNAVGSPVTGSPIAEPSVPADGTYVYTVKAKDALGNEGAATSGLSVTVDNAPPARPANAALVGSTPRTAAASITFNASTDGSGPVTYQLHRGATLVGSASTSTTLTDPSVPADATYSYTVTALDALGNESAASDAVSVTYDTTDPAAPSSVALVGSTPRKAAASFTFAASADASGPVSYQLYRGATPVGSPSTSLALSDPSVPADGTYAYTVVASDAVGNLSAASSGVSVRYDNTSPAAPGSFTRTGPSPRTTAPGFTFAASSDLSGPVTYQLFRDGTAVGSPVTGSPVAEPGVPADGTYVYTVKATDALGNEGAATSGLTVTVDNAAPARPANAALVGSTPRKAAASITFDASADGSGPVTYQLYRGATPVGSASTSTTLTDPSVPADGTHSYTVTASDALGNQSAPSDPVSVRYDNTAPTLPSTFALSGPSPRKTAPGFTFTASTDASAPISYQLYRNGSPVGSSATGAPIADPSVPADGTYSYTLVATDSLGTSSAATAAVSVKVDNTSPTVPSSFVLSGSSTQTVQPKFFFNPSSDTNPITYELYRDGTFTGVTSTASPITDLSMPVDGSADNLPVNPYHYTLRAIDGAGNESNDTSNSISVTIDSGAPSVPGNVRATVGLTRNAPVISWNASTGSPNEYRVSRDGQLISTVSAGITTFSDPLPLDGSADRDYGYTIVAADAAGNASNASTVVHVTLDTTRPASSASLTAASSPTAAKPVLIWPASASADVAGYNVYRDGSRINGSLVTTTAFTDSNLSGDGTFSYAVRAVDKAGNESTDSTATSVLYDSTAPGTPGASAMAAANGGTSTVTWSGSTDAGSGVVAYQVRRSATGGAAPINLGEGTPVCGVLPSTVLTCGDAGLVPGASYRYAVFALDAVGNVSMAGQTVAIAVPSTEDRTPPKAPTGLRAVVANGQISLSWKNPKADLARVDVVLNAKRAPRTARDGSTVYHGAGTKVTVKVPKLSAGKLVRFAVFALDKSGNASVAARATVTVPRPSTVSLAPDGKLAGNPDLTWNAVTGATYYNVQVFEGTQASKRVGISWPAVTRWTLPGKYMKKGKVYTWYVWPGIGAKSAAKYGKLIGKVTFTYVG